MRLGKGAKISYSGDIVSTETKSPEKVNLNRFRRKGPVVWLLGLLAIFVLIVLWYGVTIFAAFQQATTNLPKGTSTGLPRSFDANDTKPINILLIGVGGESHPGGTLADSIMIASIDPQTKTISLLSVPRDLYVSIPGDGKEKINAAHSIGESGKTKGGGPVLLKQVVTTALDVPIDYFIRIDFDGFKEIIDTIGGITVDVQKAIKDPLYPDAQMKGYDPFSITAGIHQLDGKTALKYARSRETTSDFDRARRQQEIIIAIRDKMLSAKVLANPKKVTDIVTLLGKHILTDMNASDMEHFILLAKDFGKPTIRTQVLGSTENNLLTSGRSPGGASIIIPKAGINDFSDVQLFAESYFAAPSLAPEHTTLRLQRTDGVTAATAAAIAEQLKWAGLTVEVDTILATDTKTTLYDVTKGQKTKTIAFLKDTYHLTAQTKTATSPTVATSPSLAGDLLLVIGPDYAKAFAGNQTTTSDAKSLASPTVKATARAQ